MISTPLQKFNNNSYSIKKICLKNKDIDTHDKQFCKEIFEIDYYNFKLTHSWKLDKN